MPDGSGGDAVRLYHVLFTRMIAGRRSAVEKQEVKE